MFIIIMITQRFIGREKELEFLERQNKGRPAFVILYGRKRVGKTALVEQFCKGKNHIYYTASESNSVEQLRELYDLIHELTGDELIKDLNRDWEVVLRYLKDKDIILVLDEFPYIIKADNAVPSKIQRLWDKELKNSNIFLILTGSSVAMMEDEVLSHKSPLYGRRTGQWKITPFGFKETRKFFPDHSFEDQIRTYAILGGIPYFLEQFDVKKDIRFNILHNILFKGAVLHNEVEFLMREELREPMNYFTILKAISQGKTKFSEIKNETGISKNSLTAYISILRGLHLIKRITPVTDKKAKNGRYYLEDNFFRFWFGQIFPNKSLLEIDTDLLLDKICSYLDIYVSYIFEDVCREFLNHRYKGYEIGKWWYGEDEIDIVALDDREKKILLGECKWSKNPVGVGTLESLKVKSSKVRWNDESRTEEYLLFSRSGFTSELEELQDDELMLYSLERMESELFD